MKHIDVRIEWDEQVYPFSNRNYIKHRIEKELWGIQLAVTELPEQPKPDNE